MGLLRLDKYLADAGLGTRSEIRKLIKSGLVAVDGSPVKLPELKLDPDAAQVSVANRRVAYERFVYYLFHKPAGTVTARTDGRDPTVMDYFRDAPGRNLSPVGRLDKDTEGLLLVTNDGALNHHLMSPAHHIEKTYYAILDREVPQSGQRLFAEGLDIGDDRKTLPARLEILPRTQSFDPAYQGDGMAHALLTISEGRFHQVKRMFAAVGCEVLYLKRVALGGLLLDGLLRGEYRRLAEEEVERLRGA